MGNALKQKFVQENLKTDIYAEDNVVVVGGGPGGHSAAVAAARNGVKTILVERYGHLGGTWGVYLICC